MLAGGLAADAIMPAPAAAQVSLRKIGTRPIVLTFEKVTIDLEEPVYLPDYPPPPETCVCRARDGHLLLQGGQRLHPPPLALEARLRATGSRTASWTA